MMASAKLVNLFGGKALKTIQYSRFGFPTAHSITLKGAVPQLQYKHRTLHTSQLKAADKLYTKEHEWISVENGTATFGITHHAQSKLGEVVYCELPEVGLECEKGETVAVVESVKAASDIYAPVSGKVTSANDELTSSPILINDSAEKDGNYINYWFRSNNLSAVNPFTT
uniref:Glycine cleavage system H protein, mitochondrial n=1 Tax=Ciona savignyi TaxID=51511 RepID=H2YR38_CIOSA